MLRRILVASAAFASSPHNKLIGVQGFVTPTRLGFHSTLTCQKLTTSHHLSAREGGGRGGRGGRGAGRKGRGGRGGRGRGRNGKGQRRSAPSTSSGDLAEGDKETESSTKPSLSYRERWFQAHPNYNMDRNNNRRGRNNNNRRGGGRRGRTPPPALPSPGQPGRNCHRDAISPGNTVYVIKKEDQRSGRETSGTVSRLLTNSRYHPRGIKVMLDDGIVGRVTRFDNDGGDLNLLSGGGGANNIKNNSNDASNTSDEEKDAYNNATTSAQTQTLADFLPSMGSNHADDNSSITQHGHPSSSEANADALATLVGMGFDKEKGNQALQMFDNDVERAANYLLLNE